MKDQKEKPTWIAWTKAIVLIILLIAFLVWIGSWWGIIVAPFIFDAYVTKRIPWTWWKDLENPVTRTIMSWVDAIVFALVAVYFVNIYFFQNYTIPSSSLEKSLLVGDYLCVSKVSYGPRVPQTPLHLPLCQHTVFGNFQSYLTWPQWEYRRVHPSRIPLNDIVVFNYPAGDTVPLTMPYQTEYYNMAYGYGALLYKQQYEQQHGLAEIDPVQWESMLDAELDSMTTLQRRSYYDHVYTLGSEYIKRNPAEFGEVVWRPVDRRENYVKRCVGTPGQTLQIKNRIIYLDGKPNKQPDNVQYNYRVELLRDLPESLTKELGLSEADLITLHQNGIIPLTEASRQALQARTDLVASITLLQDAPSADLYPQNAHYGWTRDNYGPLWIPEKGKQIPGGLTLENLPIYERPIRVYEGNDLQVTPQGQILINGKEATNYTFQMDYYWMMGDNRHNSADSRYWGFVPEDHIEGKPLMIWLSLDPDESIFTGIRWKRLFRWVDNIK